MTAPRLRSLFLRLALLCCATTLQALDPHKQMTQYLHDTWNSNGGLPQDSVNAVTQTPDGYLWVATQEGVSRFDGISFTNFDSRTTGGVLENFAHTLFTDRSGTLWVGASGGALRYAGNGRFTPAWNAVREPTTAARRITQAPDGTLWMGQGSDGISGAKGLVQYDRRLVRILRTKDGLSSDVVSAIAFDRGGAMWLATSKGVDVWKGGRVVQTYTTAQGLGDDVVRVIYVDRAGTVWAGTEHGLSRFGNGRFTTLTTADGLVDDLILCLLEDRDGALWVGTARGLDRLIDGRVDRASAPRGLTNVRINALFEDREGSLWIGTHVNGLHRLRSARFTSMGASEGLLDDSVNGLFEDRQGRIWLGTAQSGVNILDRGVIRTLTRADGVSQNGVRSFRQDPDGTMWLGSRGGLDRMRGGSVTHYGMRDGLPGISVNATARDRDGVLWVGTDRGVARLENGRFVAVPQPKRFPAAIRVIHLDRSGRLWFAGGEGLAYWDGAAFQVDPRFAAAHIQSVLEDEDGTLWFGTWSQGLLRLRGGSLTVFRASDGLHDDVAWSLLDDGRGSLWMGSNRGISRVSRRELEDFAAKRITRIHPAVFGSADGMRRRETNWGNPAAIRTGDGRLWFGTTGGVVIVDPKELRRNEVAPPVVLERFVADDHEVPTVAPRPLAAGTRNLEFHYAGLSLVATERVRYRYVLEGYDGRWIDAGTRRAAYYTNVEPGAYRFRVIAANDDGVWNETGASVAFRLTPYFWQTSWFYALLVAALILLGFAIHALRERHRRVSFQALHDSLTGLPNRLLLESDAEAALRRAEKDGRSTAILFLDLDGFKRVNDTHGHASGDVLLRAVAARFRSCVRPADTLARIGGDEFAVLVGSIDRRDVAAEVAQRVIDCVREPFVVDGHSVSVGVSVGIAVHPDDGADVRAILQAADRAMYRVKIAGGNALQYH